MNRIKLICSILALTFGVCLVVYGGYDDSPGGQLLGLLMIVGGIVGLLLSRKKSSH